jgi:hypothetical protein
MKQMSKLGKKKGKRGLMPSLPLVWDCPIQAVTHYQDRLGKVQDYPNFLHSRVKVHSILLVNNFLNQYKFLNFLKGRIKDVS